MDRLPEEIRPLFWSYNFNKLDGESDKRLVIKQVINYGSWDQWRWLSKTYGRDEIRTLIESTPTSEIRPGALKLISLLLSAKKSIYAP